MRNTILFFAALCGAAYCATTPIATRPWVTSQIQQALARQTGRGWTYTATVVTNADGTYTYSAPYAGSELTNCVSISFTYAVCTNPALRVAHSTIPGLVTNRVFYAWNGTCYTNAQVAAIPAIYPFVATNVAGQVYQSFRAESANGTEYVYRKTLGVGTFYAKTNQNWSAKLGTTMIGDVRAANLKGE